MTADLMTALKNRIAEGDDYAKQLESAVAAWESLDDSPQSILNLNDTRLITDTPSVPYPVAPRSVETQALHALPDAAVLLDTDGRVTLWNAAAVALFGWSAAEVLKQPPPFVTTVHSIEHEEILAATRRDSPIRERVVQRRGKDGKNRALTLFSRQAGTHTLMLFRAVEVKEPSEPRLETMGRLVAAVSHDFNNVLSAIIGAGDLLADRVPVDHEDREWVEIIRIAAKHASGLTRRLLDFAKPRDGASDLSAIVDTLTPLVRALVPNGVKLKVDLANHLPPSTASLTAIEQVVLNLATNAGQAMPRGGVLQLRTSHETLDGLDYVALSVADNGHGMTDDVREKLFEPYFTTHRGTGLGLATVNDLVTAAKGRIDVDSIPGMGSIFRVFFPAISAPPVYDDSAKTALVVDDDPTVREVIKRALESVGYDVSEAATGDEAVMAAHWLHNQVDLLVTDVVMPTLGGRKLVERLRKTQPDLAVVYVSGYRPVNALHDANTRFLAKPFTGRQLLNAVNEVAMIKVC